MKTLCFLFCVAFLCAQCVTVYAHGNGGTVFATVNSYLIDIDYPVKDLRAGEPLFFNVKLLDQANYNSIPFTNVIATIDRAGQQMCSANIIHEKMKATGFTCVFPELGDYNLFVRFYRGDDELITQNFDLHVMPSPKLSHEKTTNALSFLLGNVVALSATLLVRRFLL